MSIEMRSKLTGSHQRALFFLQIYFEATLLFYSLDELDSEKTFQKSEMTHSCSPILIPLVYCTHKYQL